MSLFFDIFKKLKGDSIQKEQQAIIEKRRRLCNFCIIDGVKTVLPSGQCRICGCFIKYKTTYEDEKCPDGRW